MYLCIYVCMYVRIDTYVYTSIYMDILNIYRMCSLTHSIENTFYIF